jgi:hypothetical protein
MLLLQLLHLLVVVGAESGAGKCRKMDCVYGFFFINLTMAISLVDVGLLTRPLTPTTTQLERGQTLVTQQYGTNKQPKTHSTTWGPNKRI